MTDLSALSADELAEKVREYLMRKVRYRDDDKDLIDGYEDPGGDALSELVRRASERDQAVTRLAVLDGTACAEEQAAGSGPCGACVACLRAERDQAVRERDSWQEVAEVYKTSTAAYRRDADEAVERADRLAAALKMIADFGHELDDYDAPAKATRKIARDALAADQEQA